MGGYGWSATVDVTRVAWDGGRGDPPRVGVGERRRGAPRPRCAATRSELEGTLRLPDDQGFAEALAHKGMAAQLQLRSFERIGPSANPFVRATQTFRAFVGRSIDRLFPPREAGLLLGLVLGDDSKLDPSLARDFHATGLGHLLVVSGENVAMVLAPILAFAAWAGLTRWPRFLLAMLTVVFFVVLTGAEPSVMRAGVMATLTLLGVLMGRPRSTGTILAGAVFVLIVLDPWLVWAIGFQLSVAATAGMVALGTPLAERLGRFLPTPVALAAGTTMAAQFGVTPILLFHFHEVPGVTIVANLAAFPAVSPALLMGIAASTIGHRLDAGRSVPGGVRDAPDALPAADRRHAREGAGRLRHVEGRSGRARGRRSRVRGRRHVVETRMAPTPMGHRRGRRSDTAARLVHGARRGNARRAHGAVLRRRAGRLGADHEPQRGDDPDRRGTRRGTGRHRARRARREAPRHGDRLPPARRSHHRPPQRAGADPGRRRAGARLRSHVDAERRAPGGDPRRGRTGRSIPGPVPRSTSATSTSRSSRRTSAGRAPSPTRTTTRWC